MTTKAIITGHVFDLEAAANLFDSGDVRVSEHEGEWVLSAPDLDQAWGDAELLDDVGRDLVRLVNGAARARDSSFRPIAMTGRFVGSDGSHSIFAVGTAEMREKATAIKMGATGNVTLPNLGPEYLRLADQSKDVSDALKLLGNSAVFLDWFDLWKVFEVVRANVGADILGDKNWVDRGELRRFKESANHPDASGDAARHARHRDPAPANPMSIVDARALMSQLVQHWLASL